MGDASGTLADEDVQTLRRRLAAAEERLRAQGLRIAQAEHILKSGLAVIGGWARTLDDRWATLSEGTRCDGVRIIRRRTDDLIDQTEKMLAEAQADLTAAAINPRALDLRPFLADLVAAAQDISLSHPVRFEASGDVRAWTDRGALTHVIALLLENAVKYSPEGGSITVALRDAGDAAEIAVCDEGIGLPPNGPDLFAPFERGTQQSGPIAGTGLGLYFVRGLVEAMDGTVHASVGAEGRGSTFTVHLPLLSGS